MMWLRCFSLQVVLLITPFLVTACAPVQPIARDGAGQALPIRNDAISEIREAAGSGVFDDPIDAAPGPGGEIIYFTATSAQGPGVFAVAAAGGEPAAVYTGAPLADVRGLAVAGDGRTLYVADAGAQQVWALAAEGGEPQTVNGTEGIAASGVEIVPGAEGDMLYVTGSMDGAPGIWTVAANGGEAAAVHTGAPLVTPMGVAIAGDGTIYVVDQNGFAPGRASVLRIAEGAVAPIAENFRAGEQAGAALTSDDGLLAVSAMDIDRAQAQVLLIVLDTLDKIIVTKVVGANSGSGGIHRAHDGDVFAWAGISERPKPGHVYVIKP